MKCLLSIPYKIMAITLVGAAILLAVVFAIGIPFQIVELIKS
jgi:hypothetical protein